MSNNSKISILLPTRGRTEQLDKSVSSLIDNATNPENIQWLFGFDNDDMETYQWFQHHVLPKIIASGAKYTCMAFEPMGYARLHEYVNQLAAKAVGDWFVFWNDDAIMQSSAWDQEIVSHTGKFCLQAFETHKKHPYSIFPIVPRKWYELVGHLSKHQLNDAWLSQIAWMLDIVVRIPINVEHDRYDLTGNNNDSTYRSRIIYENNHNDPKDFNYIENQKERINEANFIARYLIDQGYDLTHWENACAGKVDVWEKMLQSDVNKQMTKLSRAI